MTKLSKTKVKEAIPGTGGIYSIIAQKCSVGRTAITQFFQKEANANIKALALQEREKIVDVSENKLFKAAEEGKQWAVERVLKSLGKNRGYTEKQEIAHSGANPVNIQLIETSAEEIKNDKNKDIKETDGNSESPGR